MSRSRIKLILVDQAAAGGAHGVARFAAAVSVFVVTFAAAPVQAAIDLTLSMRDPAYTADGTDMVSAAMRLGALPDLRSVGAVAEIADAPAASSLTSPGFGPGSDRGAGFGIVDPDRDSGPDVSSLIGAAAYGSIIDGAGTGALRGKDDFAPESSLTVPPEAPLLGLRQPLAGWMESHLPFTNFEGGDAGGSWSAGSLYSGLPSISARRPSAATGVDFDSHSVFVIAGVLLGVFGMSVVLLVAKWQEGSTNVIAITDPPKRPSEHVIDVAALPAVRKEERH